MSVRGFFLFLVLGWFILILQSSVISYIPNGELQPELLLVLLAHSGVYRRGADGIALALCYGYLMDLFSGQSFGTYLLLYVTMFYLARLLSIRFLLQTRLTQMMLVFSFTLAETLMFAVLSYLLGAPQGSRLLMWDLVVQSGINALGVLLLFPCLGWLERRIRSNSHMLQLG